jgi:hypothetical protein
MEGFRCLAEEHNQDSILELFRLDSTRLDRFCVLVIVLDPLPLALMN